MTADKDQPWQPVLHVEVTDPFQVNETLSYDEYLIQLNGTGGIGENPDGWRTMRVSCPYSDPAQSCSFTPYLEVSAFNIPAADWGGRYMIYPTAYITVDWQ